MIFRFSFFLLFLSSFCSNAAVTPTLNDIWIPMSDGDSLQADVYIPSTVVSAEVILIQTPYNKNAFENSLPFFIYNDVLKDAQPFIWVIVDWRGFHGSNMADVSNVDRGQDGYDICDWIVAQSWHDNRIGTWGPSALGGVQYQLMEKNHPNHTCAVPQVATGHQSYEAYFYGGVLEKARLDQLDALGYGLSPIVMAQVYDSFVWDAASANTWYADDIKIPTLAQAGWYDHNLDEMITFYESARNTADPSVQDEQWLLVGPWVHGGTGAAYMGSSIQGELTYPNAEFKTDTMAWDFFEYYLLDIANGWDATPNVTYYEMGNDNWHTTSADNFEATTTNVLYLDQNKSLISGFGVDSTSFISDPQNPSPTIGGATLSDLLDQGPYDQSTLDSRNDVITFSTDVLNADVTALGRIQLTLFVSADQADCDIAVRLVDQYPDGTNMLITDGIKRMRFRNDAYAQSDEVFMNPGEVYEVHVDLPFTHYTWKSGHKIKIYVSGNHAVRFDVNEQDGGQMYQSTSGNTANITVHHNSTYPSKIEIPGNNPSLSVQTETKELPLVYPNPATDYITFRNATEVSSYQVYDMNGNLLISSDAYKGSINIAELPPAIYLIRLETYEGKVLEQRFSKL